MSRDGRAREPPDIPPDIDKLMGIVRELDLEGMIDRKIKDEVKELRAIIDNQEKKILTLEEELRKKVTSKPTFATLLSTENCTEQTNTPRMQLHSNPTSLLTRRSSFNGRTSQQQSRVQDQRQPSQVQAQTQALAETRIREGRGEEQTEDLITIFSASKKKIIISPVDFDDVNNMHMILTSDSASYDVDTVLFGEKHHQARIACARQFFVLELNMLERDFEIVRADYHGKLEKMSMIVTLKEASQVNRCFMRQAKVQNRKVEINTHWPHITYRRRNELFLWIKDAKKRTNLNYQLRLGNDDVQMFAKERGDYYRPITLPMFADDAGKRLEDLPDLQVGKEVAKGRPTTKKRGNTSPTHSQSNRNKHNKTEDDYSFSEEGHELGAAGLQAGLQTGAGGGGAGGGGAEEGRLAEAHQEGEQAAELQDHEQSGSQHISGTQIDLNSDISGSESDSDTVVNGGNGEKTGSTQGKEGVP